jgi:hypothetical protein
MLSWTWRGDDCAGSLSIDLPMRTEDTMGGARSRTCIVVAGTHRSVPAPPAHGGKEILGCVESGEPPRLFGVEPPRPRIATVRTVDMSSSNTWAEFAGVFCRTRSAFLEHENAKAELKGLMPEDAKEATGHGIRAKRSKSGAVSFDVLSQEADHAPVQ